MSKQRHSQRHNNPWQFGNNPNQSINFSKPTGGGGRTHTPLRATDFESVASASSATPAKVSFIILYGMGL
jgi:hypothetical protein